MDLSIIHASTRIFHQRGRTRKENVRHTYLAIEVRHGICAPIPSTILGLRGCRGHVCPTADGCHLMSLSSLTLLLLLLLASLC